MNGQPQELAAALARGVVGRVAPEEMPFFGATSRAYWASSGKRQAGRSQDEMLGFGIEDAVVLLTPVALELCHRLLEALANETAKGLASGILNKLKAWFSKKQEQQSVQFTQPELQHVREVAERTAGALHLPVEQVRLLSDALVGSLAAPTARGGP